MTLHTTDPSASGWEAIDRLLRAFPNAHHVELCAIATEIARLRREEEAAQQSALERAFKVAWFLARGTNYASPEAAMSTREARAALTPGGIK